MYNYIYFVLFPSVYCISSFFIDFAIFSTLKTSVLHLSKLLGILDQAFPLLITLDHLDPVVEAAAERVLKGPLRDSLMEEESDEGRLEMFVVELTKALEYASDPQVIVRGVVEMSEAGLPVGSTLDFSCRKI